jgi:hypothetical protein
MEIDLSGITLASLFKMTDGWGLFNLGTEVQDMIFTLSNQANGYKKQILKPEDPATFLKSTWDKEQDTIIVIHGYAEDASGGPLSPTLKVITAYEETKRPENLVFVDWHELSRQINYFASVKNVEKAGKRVAELLIYLKGAGLVKNLSNVRFVGFSLGAHVSATAAHFASQVLGEKVSRISGLDPAGPGYINKDEMYRLGKDDADFVDVMHTNMGPDIDLTTFGTNRKSGHVDFYPNGGEHQPGCSLPFIGEVVGVCSHIKANDYYANSIRGKIYMACPCSDWKTYKAGKCACPNGPNMGEFVDQTVRDNYYLAIPLGQ